MAEHHKHICGYSTLYWYRHIDCDDRSSSEYRPPLSVCVQSSVCGQLPPCLQHVTEAWWRSAVCPKTQEADSSCKLSIYIIHFVFFMVLRLL